MPTLPALKYLNPINIQFQAFSVKFVLILCLRFVSDIFLSEFPIKISYSFLISSTTATLTPVFILCDFKYLILGDKRLSDPVAGPLWPRGWVKI